MTHENSDGEIDKFGIELKNVTYANINLPTDCGTRSSRTTLSGMDFCSFDCFNKEVMKWLAITKEKIG